MTDVHPIDLLFTLSPGTASIRSPLPLPLAVRVKLLYHIRAELSPYQIILTPSRPLRISGQPVRASRHKASSLPRLCHLKGAKGQHNGQNSADKAGTRTASRHAGSLWI